MTDTLSHKSIWNSKFPFLKLYKNTRGRVYILSCKAHLICSAWNTVCHIYQGKYGNVVKVERKDFRIAHTNRLTRAQRMSKNRVWVAKWKKLCVGCAEILPSRNQNWIVMACFISWNILWAYYLICLIAGNSVDGATFLKFTREDLKDIFPTNFQFRKKIWDSLEDIVRIHYS